MSVLTHNHGNSVRSKLVAPYLHIGRIHAVILLKNLKIKAKVTRNVSYLTRIGLRKLFVMPVLACNHGNHVKSKMAAINLYMKLWLKCQVSTKMVSNKV